MILVTGGTGLVGSHILLRLSKEKIPFKALKRKRSCLKICEDIFKYYKQNHLFKKIKWVTGNVNDIPSLDEAMQDCDKVIHAAAIVSFHNEDIEIMKKTNIEGTENIVNVCLSLGIKKLAYISSIAALGRNSNTEIIDEECIFKKDHDQSYYALSKYYAEQEVWRGSEEGLDVVITNPSVILGPGDWNKGSSQIFKKIFTGLKFYTSGSSGYVDVIDVANCAIKLLESDIKNKRFIINSDNLKYQELFNLISDKFKKPRPSIKVTPFLKEVAWRLEYLKSFLTNKKPLITKQSANFAMKNTRYSNTKIKESINYQFIPIEESVEKYCDWFRNRILKS